MDLRGVVQLWELMVPGLGGQRVVFGALGAVVFWSVDQWVALGCAEGHAAWGCMGVKWTCALDGVLD